MFLEKPSNGPASIPAMSLSTTPWNKPVPKVLWVYNLHYFREHVVLHCSSKRIIWCCWSSDYSLLISYITLVHSDLPLTSQNRCFFWKVSLFIFIALSLKIIAVEHCATKLFYTFISMATSTLRCYLYYIFWAPHAKGCFIVTDRCFEMTKGIKLRRVEREGSKT